MFNTGKAPLSGNQLTVEALNSQRRQAVQLRLEGHTLSAVKQATQLSAPTIIAAVKAFKTGGWAAVTVNPRRGRPAAQAVGADRKLSHF